MSLGLSGEKKAGVRRNSVIDVQERLMDVRERKAQGPIVERRKMTFEYQPSLSQGTSPRRLFPVSYFSLESLVLLFCLTASLLILPLILPPLPPPPFMLLLVPIAIMAVLMVLAFMPSNARDITYTYM